MTLPDLFEAIRDFAHAPTPAMFGKSEHLGNQDLTFYMRNTSAFYNLPDFDYRGFLPTLTISNIELPEHLRGQGHYAAILKLFLELGESLQKVVCIENVLTPEHHPIYLRRGFSMVPLPGNVEDYEFSPRSFFKLPEGLIDDAKEKAKAKCSPTPTGGRLGSTQGKTPASA